MLAFTHSVEPAAFVPTHDQPAAEGVQEDTQQTLTASPPLYLVSAGTMSSTMARQSVGRWRTRSPTFIDHFPDARCLVFWPDQHLVITETDPVTLIGSGPVSVFLVADNQTDLTKPVSMRNKFADSVFWVHVYHFLGGVEA